MTVDPQENDGNEFDFDESNQNSKDPVEFPSGPGIDQPRRRLGRSQDIAVGARQAYADVMPDPVLLSDMLSSPRSVIPVAASIFINEPGRKRDTLRKDLTEHLKNEKLLGSKFYAKLVAKALSEPEKGFPVLEVFQTVFEAFNSKDFIKIDRAIDMTFKTLAELTTTDLKDKFAWELDPGKTVSKGDEVKISPQVEKKLKPGGTGVEKKLKGMGKTKLTFVGAQILEINKKSGSVRRLDMIKGSNVTDKTLKIRADQEAGTFPFVVQSVFKDKKSGKFVTDVDVVKITVNKGEGLDENPLEE